MKFIKFGYGRATDHASKDIRDGLITRDKGIEYVNHYDHVKPMKSLNHWLEYVQMKERDFDEILRHLNLAASIETLAIG